MWMDGVVCCLLDAVEVIAAVINCIRSSLEDQPELQQTIVVGLSELLTKKRRHEWLREHVKSTWEDCVVGLRGSW